MDFIHIDNLSFFGRHGVSTRERTKSQEFIVSVRLSFNTKKPGISDRIKDTYDYRTARDIIQKVIERKSVQLIERLAVMIAAEILNDARVREVEVCIKKTMWKSGIPGVTITRKQHR